MKVTCSKCPAAACETHEFLMERNGTLQSDTVKSFLNVEGLEEITVTECARHEDFFGDARNGLNSTNSQVTESIIEQFTKSVLSGIEDIRQQLSFERVKSSKTAAADAYLCSPFFLQEARLLLEKEVKLLKDENFDTRNRASWTEGIDVIDVEHQGPKLSLQLDEIRHLVENVLVLGILKNNKLTCFPGYELLVQT